MTGGFSWIGAGDCWAGCGEAACTGSVVPREATGALAVLLRPDRYVAGLARDAAEIDVLLQRVPGVAGVVRHD